jgi:hypothetical protein
MEFNDASMRDTLSTAYGCTWFVQTARDHATVMRVFNMYPLAPWSWAIRSRYTDWTSVVAAPDAPWDSDRLDDRADDVTDELFISHPDFPWPWRIRSRFTDWDAVVASPDAPWHWHEFTEKAPMAFVKAHAGKPWDKCAMCYRPDFDMALARSWIPSTRGFAKAMSVCPVLDMRLLRIFPDEDWDWGALSRHALLDMSLVLKFPYKDWDWRALSCHLNLDMLIVHVHPSRPWLHSYLSSHPRLAMMLVRDMPDKPWDWQTLSSHPRLDMHLVRILRQRWNYRALSSHPRLDMDLVREFPDENWDCQTLSSHPRLDMTLVRDMPDRPTADKAWDWHTLSSHPRLDMDLVRILHPRRWNYQALSSHPRLDIDLVSEFPDEDWDWGAITRTHTLRLSDKLVMRGPLRGKPWDLLRFYRVRFMLTRIQHRFAARMNEPGTVCYNRAHERWVLGVAQQLLDKAAGPH